MTADPTRQTTSGLRVQRPPEWADIREDYDYIWASTCLGLLHS